MDAKAWVRPVVLAVSCLVIGFVGGWTAANVGGGDIALPDAKVDVTVAQPSPSTTTVADEQPSPPARSAVSVKVLNGTTTDGVAARTATTLEGLGYAKVTSDNGPRQTGPTTIYYRAGRKPAADQLAKDMQVTAVAAVAGTALESIVPAGTQVIVLLGSG